MIEEPRMEGKSTEAQLSEIKTYLTRLSEEINLLSSRESALPDRVILIEQSGGRLVRKWSSGLMEQWYKVTDVASGGTAWGSIYYCDKKLRVKFEPSFIEPPNVTYSISSTIRDGFLDTSGECSKDYSPAYYFCRPVSTGFEGTYTVSFYAVGRWK